MYVGLSDQEISVKCLGGMSFLLLVVILGFKLSEGDDAGHCTNNWMIPGCKDKCMEPRIEEMVPDAFTSLTAVYGGKVELPCDISSPLQGDEVYLVLWYKDEFTTPIYSFDARKGRLTQARHAASDNLARRTYFSTIAKPSVLEMDSLVAEDEGEYRCRVDFRKARTRHSTVYLQVIVPPGIPIIKDHNGEVLQGMIGPYNEGDRLLLICECDGGKPLPSLSWWNSTILLDDTYSVASDNRVRNELEIPVLKRIDLMAMYICQASNNNISVPTTTSVTLEMNFRPLEVKIEGKRNPLSANRRVEVSCRTTGSRPPAIITWRKGSTKLRAGTSKVEATGSATTSTLMLTPTSEDNGKFLYCQADNLLIPSSTIEDVWRLEVHFIPELNLRLGSNLRHSNIQEGNDVYFECNVRANPWVTETGWRYDNHELHTNITAGVIVSNQTLVLQRVSRLSRGRYSCVAANSEGQGESNHVHLRVQFAPVCKKGQKILYGAIFHSAVRIICEVEADPPDVDFRWEFNNTSSSMIVVPFRSAGTQSVVNHIPRTEHDFGTLFCWGKNNVGLQRHPCVYAVIPADFPGSVKNCSVHSETERSFLLHCLEGDDGGIDQHFLMEVREAATHKLHLNTTSDRPSFIARGLPSGTIFLVTVYAKNAKGKSPAVILRVATLSPPESQTQKDDMWQLNISPILLVLIAVVGGLVTVALSVILYLKARNRQKVRKNSMRTMDSCKSLTLPPPPFTEEECDACSCKSKKDAKTPILITGNGLSLGSSNKAKDDELMFINSNCVGWKKFPVSKSSDREISKRSDVNVSTEEKDAGIATSPSSHDGSVSPTITSQEDTSSQVLQCNSRYSSRTSLTDESNASAPLMSTRRSKP